MQRPIQLAQLLILLLTSSVKSDDVLQISITGKNTFGGEIFENVLKQSQINIIDNDSLDVVKSYDDLISLYSDGVVEIHIPSNLLENRHIAWSPIEDKAIFIEKDVKIGEFYKLEYCTLDFHCNIPVLDNIVYVWWCFIAKALEFSTR